MRASGNPFSRPLRRYARPLGLSATLHRLSTRRQFPTDFVRGCLLPYEMTGYLTRRGLDFRRMVRTLSLPIDPLRGAPGTLPAIEVTIPCGPGDVDVLPLAVQGAFRGSSNPIKTIRVVVPGHIRPAVVKAVGSSAEVVDENDIVSPALVSRLARRFPARRNWVLQQLVKVASVLGSDSAGVMILDADTTLMSPRTWLTAAGTQILTPTIEWHAPYYNFLEDVSNGEWPCPEFSFVPHHMLCQPGVLVEILASVGLRSVDDLAQALGDESTHSTTSMFCVEYELYAQGLQALMPARAKLAKWSNRNASRCQDIGLAQAQRYMSISRHHYLEK